LVTAYDEGLRNDVGLAEYMVGLRVYSRDTDEFNEDGDGESGEVWDGGGENDGGGGGGKAKPFQVLLRVLFDVSWWVAITLLLTNVVAGIIIDSFAELREGDKRLQLQLDTKCLVCDVDASELNTRGGGFRKHLLEEHNLWNYLWVRLRLRE